MENYKDDIKHIRSMMERSSTFISLSGLSGIFAGIFALIGAIVTYLLLKEYQINYFDGERETYQFQLIIKLMFIAAITLLMAVLSGIWFTMRKSKKSNLPLWTSTTRNVLLHLSIPLIVGGFCSILLIYHHHFYLVAPFMLIFYGLALVNASKYTHQEIFYLGLSEIVLGLLAGYFIGYGLVFWALGFGVLHILYGILLHQKYK